MAKWGRVTVGVIVLSVCLAAVAFGQDNRWQGWQNLPQAPAVDGIRAQDAATLGRALSGAFGRLNFITVALNDVPDMEKMAREHNDIMQGLEQALVDLRTKTRQNLNGVEDDKARDKITKDAVAKASVMLGLIVDESVKYDRLVADTVEKHKNKIVLDIVLLSAIFDSVSGYIGIL